MTMLQVTREIQKQEMEVREPENSSGNHKLTLHFKNKYKSWIGGHH